MSGMSTIGKRKVLSLEQKLSCDRLQLLLVGKSKCPPAMIAVQKLPVVYDYQPNAWPMYHTIIQSLKKRYRNELLRRMILSDADGDDLDKVEQLLAVDISLFETLTDDNILEAGGKHENEEIDVSDTSDMPNEGLSNSETYSPANVLFK
ncbi:hypothetical protein T11_11621 [Trichinella zimbabwensis]|uniref:DDE-1 domain-containing protein n=1 Tax=Trichinella zimbabwensis TaxID=268475 RepID=A0A0V1H1R2_9BILA|nr:hypothetical protein T11_11621 [Trichinella zimbabwensis]